MALQCPRGWRASESLYSWLRQEAWHSSTEEAWPFNAHEAGALPRVFTAGCAKRRGIPARRRLGPLMLSRLMCSQESLYSWLHQEAWHSSTVPTRSSYSPESF